MPKNYNFIIFLKKKKKKTQIRESDVRRGQHPSHTKSKLTNPTQVFPLPSDKATHQNLEVNCVAQKEKKKKNKNIVNCAS